MQQKQTMKEVYKYANNSPPKSGRNKSKFSPFGLYFQIFVMELTCLYNNN